MAEFTNPYTPLRAALEARRQALENEPMPEMFSPEEVAARKSKLAKDRMYGEIGLISRDPAIDAVAKPLLQEAIKASQKKQTDHGEYDPATGQFRYFPQVQRQRQEERIDKQVTDASTREAAAAAKWEADRARAEDQLMLRRTIAGLRQPSDPGSITFVGNHPETGQPILLHSKKGLFSVSPEGTAAPYAGPIGHKDQAQTAGERKHLTDTMTNVQGLQAAHDALSKVPNDWQTKLTTGIVPGFIADRGGPAGQAAVQNARPEELNKADQMLTYITDGIRAGRFGMTLTPQEKASAVQYLPSQYENIDRKQAKIKGLMELLTRDYNNQVKTGTKPGYPPPGSQLGPGGAPAALAPTPQRRATDKPARRFEVIE